MPARKLRLLLAGCLVVVVTACQETAAPDVTTDLSPQFGPGGKKGGGGSEQLSAPRNLRVTGNTTFSVSLA